MNKIIPFLFAIIICSQLTAQNRNFDFKFGKEGSASINLIDKELTVYKDKTNSILKFEIVNNNPYPIYIPQPQILSGDYPQYFDLLNESIECEFPFLEMIARNSYEFILISANSSKEFELHKEFYQNSCLRFDEPESAILAYRAFATSGEDNVLAKELMMKDRDSRDVTEYMLTTKMKSQTIKIRYEKD